MIIVSSVCAALFFLLGSYLLLSKRGNRKANMFLGLFFLLWGIDFIDGILLLNGSFISNPNWAFWTDPFVFLYGPLLLWYTKSIQFSEFRLSIKSLLHLLPFILFMLILLFSYHLQPTAVKSEILSEVISFEPTSGSMVFLVAVYIQFFAYIVASRLSIKAAYQELKGYYSNITLEWLYLILNSFSLIVILSIVASLLQVFVNKIHFQFALPVLASVIVIFMARIIFKVLDQPSLLTAGKMTSGRELHLDKNELTGIASAIRRALDDSKVYLDPDMNLEKLAIHVNSSPKKVSSVINNHFNKNFFDLMNSYRIEEAKRIFEENKDPRLTVLEVMYEVGYNSKSSFNTQFKAKTGLTPSEYKRQHN
ncbi:MAG: helix-turn-helix domain-containing protein [Bacteroidia bacterium]|nr:helix-turn-helix domain-containing protein [Bacteroidia bacterium]NNF31090.1 AraC family transcriptional regulator [Flavobacteriaceae bacterium]MBT8276946.1 helix-turn-helix domain-containing protein [Bacteroidia bacterium]NNJ82458.1 AraC family transcriptional regulator [Flavobacteriaceae bacterium]NNK55323.1 AraC family transcriptional regulator [Flavobacteriaceae bacterium]